MSGKSPEIPMLRLERMSGFPAALKCCDKANRFCSRICGSGNFRVERGLTVVKTACSGMSHQHITTLQHQVRALLQQGATMSRSCGLHVACANNMAYTVLHALVKEYPTAASLRGRFLERRLPEEYLFGCIGGCHYLNGCAYFGLKGYVKNTNQLGPGHPWSDFWRKVYLSVVARVWKQLPEKLLGSDGSDCY